MGAQTDGGPAARVTHVAGDEFDIAVRNHHLRVDQPVADGGADTGPTPTELFVSSVASCVAFYARRYLDRHDLPTEGLAVDAHATMAASPARVCTVDLRVEVPAGVPESRRAALLAVASHCTVHNTLMDPPVLKIELCTGETAALAPVA